MKKNLIFFSILLSSIFFPLIGYQTYEDQNASFPYIDVVIPSIDKDLETLNLCIRGIKKYGSNVRRVIVVSSKKLTNEAEWFDEAYFPFDKYSVAYELNQRNLKNTEKYLSVKPSRVGWYFQQLLKLYAPFVIPDISPNVLILDSDTIFLKPVEFIDRYGRALYNTGIEYNLPYFEHFKRFLPSLSRLDPKVSGICHHMLFQRHFLEDLFDRVEALHEEELWAAFCKCVDPKQLPYSGASEYEIYFSFIFSNYPDQVRIRNLHWTNSPEVPRVTKAMLLDFQSRNLDYVSIHRYFL